MGVFTIVLFLAYTLGLGFTASFFVRNSENFFERSLMRIGFGLSLLPFAAITLNIAGVPADWRIILAISILYPLYFIIRNFFKLHTPSLTRIKLTRANLNILIVLLIFFASFYVYGTGAFSYPYLENDDPWAHATGVKYFSMEKDAFAEEAKSIRYLNPYPPAYDVLLGVLLQTNDSVYWTLKFFNALIISLGVIFFYFFVKEFSGSGNKALFAAFALASIPAFLSHFIWAIALSVPLYFVAFYALERIKHDRKWWIAAGLVMFTVLTSSPTHSTYFGLIFVLYLATKMILEKKVLLWHAAAGAFGLIMSFLFWWLPMIMEHGLEGVLKSLGIGTSAGNTLLKVAGTADRSYSFSDFFIAQKQNMINNPIGIGIFLTILTVIAVVFLFLRFKHLLKKENHWLIITFVWLLFTLYAVNAAKMPIKLSPFRAWVLLAIPVCILAAEGSFNIMGIAKKSAGKIGMYALLAILLTGIYFTSTQQKIAVNTAIWPPGAFWTSGDEIAAYLWVRENIPKNSNVFTFVSGDQVIAMDKFICKWCANVQDYQENGFNDTAEDTYKWMRGNNFEYIIIDGITARSFGVEQTNSKASQLAQSQIFTVVFQNRGAIIFKI